MRGNNETEQCSCIKIEGHYSSDTWLLRPRDYKRSTGYLALADYTKDPYIWLHYVESNSGKLAADDVLKSTDSKFWSIHDVQRYFLGRLHCEEVLFTYQYPNLRMPTRHGSHLWNINTALKLPSKHYQKYFDISLENTLHKIETNESQMDRLIISDQLVKLNQLHYFKRKTFMKYLLNILCLQNRLQLVSLENLCCSRMEGVRLIQQLACFNADTLKYLFLWRFVQPNENPILINFSYITASGRHIPRPDTKQCYLRSLAQLQNLRVLALEYSHLADETGAALLALLPVMKKSHFRLQLICREDHIPGRNDIGLGGGGLGIDDRVWRMVTVACPDLYLMMTFFRIRENDYVRLFLTPSVPLREAHLEYGIDLNHTQRHESDVSCFVRHIAHFYGNALVTLSIHQWRFAKFRLSRIFELMPHLARFHYIGQVDEEDLRRSLIIVACGVCDKLEYLNVQIQETTDFKMTWVQSVADEFSQVMKLFDINFCVGIYKI